MTEQSLNQYTQYSIKHALEYGASVLLRNFEHAHKEALILLQHATKKPKENLIAHSENLLSETIYSTYQDLLARRLNGEPIAYIVNQKEFWSLPFYVARGVLIPRPETELLVELALDLLPIDKAAKVLDLGTGCGCIALAIASERPKVKVTACDISNTCLEIAKINAARLKIDSVTFVVSDWFSNLAHEEFDLIISNPPYIAATDKNLHAFVRKFEPDNALLAENNGLAHLKYISQHAPMYIKQNGYLLVEHGWDQGDAVRQLLNEYGYQSVNTSKDIQNYERVTIGNLNQY